MKHLLLFIAVLFAYNHAFGDYNRLFVYKNAMAVHGGEPDSKTASAMPNKVTPDGIVVRNPTFGFIYTTDDYFHQLSWLEDSYGFDAVSLSLGYKHSISDWFDYGYGLGSYVKKSGYKNGRLCTGYGAISLEKGKRGENILEGYISPVGYIGATWEIFSIKIISNGIINFFMTGFEFAI